MRPLIVDALACGKGKRRATRDVIGAGPRSLAGVLEDEGFKPRVVTVFEFLSGFNTTGFDLLMISGMTSDLTSARRTVSRWKKMLEAPVIIGGPIASDPLILGKVAADIAVTGEGEITMSKLLESGLSRGDIPDSEVLSRIKGISFREGDEIMVSPLRPAMERTVYDEQSPSIEIVMDYPLFRSARIYVEVLRGCSNYHRARLVVPEGGCRGCELCSSGGLEDRYYCPRGVPPGCGYCSVPSVYGPPRSRSTDKIVNEIEGLLGLGVRRIVLSAPGFLDYGRDLLVEPEPLTDPRYPEPNYSALEELLSNVASLDAIHRGDASFMIENLKGELVTKMSAELLGRYLAGTPVNIGFETGSESHANLIGRSSTPKENLAAIKRLRGADLKPYVYFVHGLPGQNNETVEATVVAIRKSVDAGAERIILYRFRPLPMSAFHDQPGGPPAVKDELSGRIYEEAMRANALLKQDLMGMKMRVVVAEPYDRDSRYSVAYPMLHGPVVLIEGVEGMEGSVVEVEIARLVSNRMVEGSLSPKIRS